MINVPKYPRRIRGRQRTAGIVVLCLLGLVCALTGTWARAGDAIAAPAVTDARDLEAFFDGLVPAMLKRAGIPGGAVSVVKDGRIEFSKGYGVADLVTHRKVDAATTLLRQGSISKLFTWTAVMQLVEQGKLKLDADVNQYLDFRLPDTYPEPITVANLLTHTAGFEEVDRQIFTQRASQLVPLGEYLRRHVPARIFAPGARIAYSNYGAALAGYLVERVSGEPFERYVARHILEPLGMSHSTFAQPLSPGQAAALSQSYEATSKATPEPFTFVQIAPAGALTSTVTDMSRFMIAHLHDGKFEDRRILEPQTAELMHARHYEVAPGRNGFAYGFWEATRNGWRLMGHSGDVGNFHAVLYLIPAADCGIILALNATGEQGRTLGSDVVRNVVINSFVDRYFPGPIPEEPTVATAQADARRVAGYYGTTRRNESARRFMVAFDSDDEIEALADGTIQVSSRIMPSGALKRWREVGPLVYREVDGQAHLSFVQGAAGQILYWVSDDYPPAMVFERLHGLRGSGLLQPLLFVSLLVCLLAVIAAATRVWRRRRRRSAGAPAVPRRPWSAAAHLACGLQALVLLSWLCFVLFGLRSVFTGGSLVPLNMLRACSVLAITAAAPTILYAVRAVTGAGVSLATRLSALVLALASVYIGWFVASYGMVSFSSSF